MSSIVLVRLVVESVTDRNEDTTTTRDAKTMRYTMNETDGTLQVVVVTRRLLRRRRRTRAFVYLSMVKSV